MSSNPNPVLSESDYEKMRAMLNQHDQMQKSFDLNKPPQQQYRYQEFPRLVYNHETRRHATVHSEQQLAEALEAGYQKEPFPSDPPEETVLDEESQNELAAVEAKLKKIRKAKKPE